MVTYQYTAISRNGEKVNGVVEAYNELDAVDRIKQNCDVVLKMKEVKDDEMGLLNREIGGNKLNAKAFTVMCSQFAIIIRSGVPIARAVRLIAEKTTDKKLKKILTHVAADVESGRSLAASFEERGGDLFPPTFVETIRAGEDSGTVDRSFESMQTHYEKQTKIRQKIRSALAYPAFVLVIAVIVVIVLMVVVVPVFEDLFASYGAELPGVTKALIAISNFFRKYTLWIAAALILIFIGCKIYGNTEEGRLKLAKLALKLPLLGNIQELTAASQFANSLTMMLKAGLPLTRCVSITSKVISNYHISQEVGKLAGKLEEGQSLGKSLRAAGVMPDILTDMVAVGEESGEMESTVGTIAKYYDDELETAIQSVIAKLEPAVLIVLAVVAGFIVVAMYIAMFQLYAAM